MGIFWLIWTNDTMAYLIGSQIGRRKLFERISPKKTWEGTIGGAICTVLMAWAISLYFNDFSTAQWLAVGAMVGIFGTLGDLVESMLKRSIGVKDSGTLLPGHGGLLDRFDSFLFVVVWVWVVVRVLGA
jgi:phosphatidate cytidylyltransferase